MTLKLLKITTGQVVYRTKKQGREMQLKNEVLTPYLEDENRTL